MGLSTLQAMPPMDVVRHPPALVERLREAVERNPTGRVTEKDLAALDIDPSTAVGTSSGTSA